MCLNDVLKSLEILALSELCQENGGIDPTLYGKYEVKRGLRDISGKGVLAGLTKISEIFAYKEEWRINSMRWLAVLSRDQCAGSGERLHGR